MVSATAPPAIASRKRTGEKTVSGDWSTTTRSAEIAAWFTKSGLAPKNTAAAIARNTTTPIRAAPEPMTSTIRHHEPDGHPEDQLDRASSVAPASPRGRRPQL